MLLLRPMYRNILLTNGKDRLYHVQNQNEYNAYSTNKHNPWDDLLFESFSNCMLVRGDLRKDTNQATHT